ncbi:MAG: segregation and condensation protein A [Anaerolineae bacterium]
MHTAHFEGPLALLLRLIEEEELDITQIALAQVTDQFLQRVEALKRESEIDVVADFLVVAARLLWIKSRVLLPQREVDPASERETEDVGDELVRQLRAYRQYKEAAQWLRERHEARLHAHVRVAPLPRPQQVTVDLAGLTVEGLHALAQNAIYPTETPRPEEAIQRTRFSIARQIRLLRRRLTQEQEVPFHTLLASRPSRMEVVVTLQAILELLKQQLIRARQRHRFGDIFIRALVPPERISVPTASDHTPPAPPPARQ